MFRLITFSLLLFQVRFYFFGVLFSDLSQGKSTLVGALSDSDLYSDDR